MDQALTNPQLAGLRGVPADPNLAFHEKVARASAMDGLDDPNHPTRQAFNAWMHQQFPTAQDWQKHVESYPAVGPDQWQTPVPLGPAKEWLGGPILNAAARLTGQPSPGTGFNWRSDSDAGQRFNDIRNRYNVSY